MLGLWWMVSLFAFVLGVEVGVYSGIILVIMISIAFC